MVRALAGKSWLPYEFRYKPGEVHRPPPWVAPHQPRLDWQMWFAALGSYHHNPWLVHLCVKLLQGSPEVVDLLDVNALPFPVDSPPRVRSHPSHTRTPVSEHCALVHS